MNRICFILYIRFLRTLSCNCHCHATAHRHRHSIGMRAMCNAMRCAAQFDCSFRITSPSSFLLCKLVVDCRAVGNPSFAFTTSFPCVQQQHSCHYIRYSEHYYTTQELIVGGIAFEFAIVTLAFFNLLPWSCFLHKESL
jgi:hypothetical protein